MPDYYNDLITEKSWQTLQNLIKQIDFVLIGGWAVYLYTKSLKSKDIDIIVSYDSLSKLKSQKDMLDIISLLSKTTIDWSNYKNRSLRLKKKIIPAS